MFERIRQVLSRLFGKSTVEQALHIKTAMSSDMVDAVELWAAMYQGNAPWLSATVQSLNLPSAIAAEVARLVTIEMQSEITGSARADQLNASYQVALANLRRYVEYGCAKGGLVLKPYISSDGIAIDFMQADQFYPVAFDSKGNMTEVVFVERKRQGDTYYSRLEHHKLTGAAYEITNKAYRSENEGYIGVEVALDSVSEWAELRPETHIDNINAPLYGYFKPALANTVDTTSPLGVSVFSRAAALIQDADKQYSRLLWEFEGSELAIDASEDLFEYKTNGKRVLPKGKERLFRTMNVAPEVTGENMGMKVFSPTIRDEALRNGLNEILTRIEDTCGLARGTFSEQQADAKTATEIKVLRQRSYATVTDNQKALQTALEQLVYAMDCWATIGGLSPGGKYELAFEWDDSIVVDAATEQTVWLQEVAAGLMTPVEYRMRRYGETEEQARKMLPPLTALTE